MFTYPARNEFGPTIIEALAELRAETEEGIVFYGDDLSQVLVTFSELYERVVNCAENLKENGLKPGDRVGLVVPNPQDFVVCFLGALAARLVPVPMYPPFSLGKLDSYVTTAAAILEQAEARVLVTDAKMERILWSLVDRVKSVERVIKSESLQVVPKKPRPFELGEVELDDTAFLQFTSGSTSAPKGVVITHKVLLANMDAFMRAYEIGPGDKALSWLPLFHDLGLIGFVLATCWYGLPTVILPTALFVKRPALWMQAAHEHQATISCAPNFAFALATRRTTPAQREKLDLGRLRMLGCGAEPTHPDTIQAFLDAFIPCGLTAESIVSVYGLAENVLGVSFSPLREPINVDSVDRDIYANEGRAVPSTDDADAATGAPGSCLALRFVSVGFTYPGFKIEVLDSEGNLLPDRMVGEIRVRGPSMAAGYFNNPEASKNVFTPDGLMTGDLGYLANNELFLTGRKKDTIIINGRNYDPQSIEWVVQDIPGIRKGNVVAFSVNSSNSETLVIVAETAVETHDELRQAILAQVRQDIGLSVHEICFLEPGALPKTSSGKLQRAKTRDAYLLGTLGKEGTRTIGGKANIDVLARHLARSAYTKAKTKLGKQFGAP